MKSEDLSKQGFCEAAEKKLKNFSQNLLPRSKIPPYNFISLLPV